MKVYQAQKIFMPFTQILFLAVFLSSNTYAQDLNNQFQVGHDTVKVEIEARDASCRNIKHIEVGKMFCAIVKVSSAKPAVVKDLKLESFDAQMPAHRHGMVTRPTVKAKNLGEYLIEGVKLHMTGDWVIHLKFLSGSTTSQVAIPLKL